MRVSSLIALTLLITSCSSVQSQVELVNKHSETIIEGSRDKETLIVPTKPNVYRSRLVESIMLSENPTHKGYNTVVNKWYPIKSSNDSKYLNPTQKEIGYGVVVRPEWIGSDTSKWIQYLGKPLELSKGITHSQLLFIINLLLDDIDKDLYRVVGSKYETLDPAFQSYWQKVIYNAGIGVLYKNRGGKRVPTNMLQSLRLGYPIDAMHSAFTVWWAGHGADRQPMRGLLNRRLNDYNESASDLKIPSATTYSWGNGSATIHFNSNFVSGVRPTKLGTNKVTYIDRGIRAKNSKTYSTGRNGEFY